MPVVGLILATVMFLFGFVLLFLLVIAYAFVVY